ncbi:Erd1p Ecym_5466 [Eremothecium cymbalariae DBVPG|uniref:EXS domain-containing protein n=1 Tax=Eremothecium cymbalariae (strain CBS 270.75 / DBVPG 7215 / KCTC 17166 / NRRL Y-17582) TaxID=931890 RepID=I6NDS2_ERECY|nr:hypothetical protein Ecym_5466 [Eremothecium cymbalariae DBVPG\
MSALKAGEVTASLSDYVFILFPIPQHVVLLVILGLWLWYWELCILSWKMDIPRVIIANDPYDIRPQPSSSRILSGTRKCVVKITKIILPWHLLVFLILQKSFNVQQDLPTWLLVAINFSGLLQFLVILFILLRSSAMLRRCLKGILFWGDIEGKPLRTNYVLLADTLTSYSKPFMDFGLYLWYLTLLPFDKKLTLTESSSEVFMNFDLAIGLLPYLIRFIQCLREYARLDNPWSTRRASFFNALKYFSYFPIIVCGLFSRISPETFPSGTIYWFMLFNSCYSFWWDITMDWKLGLLDFSSTGVERNEILRKRRLYSNDWYYYGAIVFDFVVKFMWMWELLIKRVIVSWETNLLWLHTLEVFRRWIWTFFKVETEYLSVGTKK